MVSSFITACNFCDIPSAELPVLIRNYPLLQRNMLHAAVTRGKKFAILIGTGNPP
jgi:ATP-dependent exoDNAse (exonuclease V) alpha subunit